MKLRIENLIEQDLRWEIDDEHFYYNGIDEDMSIDHMNNPAASYREFAS